jgi:hypothetical protein
MISGIIGKKWQKKEMAFVGTFKNAHSNALKHD